ncbi:MAG: hypothetical protein LBR24_01855, partial [Methanobrevibacter sp.]|nr:hypothetical protein [Methanobrevibacter sp.]
MYFGGNELLIEDSNFTSNSVSSSAGYGGALMSFGNKVEIQNTKFENNNANNGGAIFNGQGTIFNINNSTFRNNSGTAIYNYVNNTTINNSKFLNNSGVMA